MFFVEPKDQGRLRFQTLRVAVTAHVLGRDPSFLSEALALPDRAGRSDTKALGCLTPRGARINLGDHTARADRPTGLEAWQSSITSPSSESHASQIADPNRFNPPGHGSSSGCPS